MKNITPLYICVYIYTNTQSFWLRNPSLPFEGRTSLSLALDPSLALWSAILDRREVQFDLFFPSRIQKRIFLLEFSLIQWWIWRCGSLAIFVCSFPRLWKIAGARCAATQPPPPDGWANAACRWTSLRSTVYSKLLSSCLYWNLEEYGGEEEEEKKRSFLFFFISLNPSVFFMFRVCEMEIGFLDEFW